MFPKVIYVEGNIGTGKSTFLKQLDDDNLKKKYNYDVIYEPVDEWQRIGILEKFYSDPKRYCYLFQSYCLFSRFNLLDKIDENLDYVFIERSIFSDHNVFAKGCKHLNQLNDIEYNIYKIWFDKFKSVHPTDYYHIYLQLNPEICLQRINQRNRNEETSITIEYLQLLHDRHESWLNTDKKCLKTYDNTKLLEPVKVIEEVHYLLLNSTFLTKS
tara:strand:+ start:94 stop:735 length:642 start_codon:yes stop_codon:yes gene_type:complete